MTYEEAQDQAQQEANKTRRTHIMIKSHDGNWNVYDYTKIVGGSNLFNLQYEYRYPRNNQRPLKK